MSSALVKFFRALLCWRWIASGKGGRKTIQRRLLLGNRLCLPSAAAMRKKRGELVAYTAYFRLLINRPIRMNRMGAGVRKDRRSGDTSPSGNGCNTGYGRNSPRPRHSHRSAGAGNNRSSAAASGPIPDASSRHSSSPLSEWGPRRPARSAGLARCQDERWRQSAPGIVKA